ncbi:coniferyl aldehyde dehydrogenase [Defluviimonas sp. SAOS-178_SWC]|uniref:coniferyl aldehyde dehydrogenase n=1 Tax=Defluviimonas sp. SAOS-178_SWC TaxID=3121287 RepID=UPI0032217834
MDRREVDVTGLAAILEIQRRAFAKDGIPDLAVRRARLERLKAAIRAHKGDFVRAAAADFGRRPAEETIILDLGPVVQAINHMRRHLGRWMRPERRPVPFTLWPGRARVMRQPKAVVGIMAPWNHPFGLSFLPLATALAAGNRAMLKLSEQAPESARAMGAMLAECFAPEEVAVVTGGAEVGAAFAGLPFDHLVFTGSTEVGRKVMRAAAESLVPVTLELGGKSPVILGRDADFGKAARDIAFGKIANAGQTCIAPDYVLVHEADADGFLARLTAAMNRTLAGGQGMTTIVSDRHAGRLRALVAEAEASGAKVAWIGGGGEGRQVAPALITGAAALTAVMREEIFGPLLPILRYRDLVEAIAHVRAGPRPLALYYYGGKEGRDTVLAGTISGNVTVNGVMTHYAVESLPFGGIGASGMGAYHGREGFEAMSHARGVFDEPLRSLIPLGRPGGPFVKLLARYMMR